MELHVKRYKNIPCECCDQYDDGKNFVSLLEMQLDEKKILKVYACINCIKTDERLDFTRFLLVKSEIRFIEVDDINV